MSFPTLYEAQAALAQQEQNNKKGTQTSAFFINFRNILR